MELDWESLSLCPSLGPSPACAFSLSKEINLQKKNTVSQSVSMGCGSFSWARVELEPGVQGQRRRRNSRKEEQLKPLLAQQLAVIPTGLGCIQQVLPPGKEDGS